MKAVILAAGKGTRLGELGERVPKAMLEVAGRPVIVHIIDGLFRAGISQFVVVTGHLGEQIEAELGNGAAAGIEIRYERQQQIDGTARALALARGHLGGEPFFFSWGDILAGAQNYARVIRAARLADAALAVNEVEDPWAGGAVYTEDALPGESRRITRIVEKPRKGTSTTRWNNAGFGVLGTAIWEQIDRLQPSPRGEYELPQALAALVESGARVVAVPVEGPWFDIGTPEQLEAANSRFAISDSRF